MFGLQPIDFINQLQQQHYLVLQSVYSHEHFGELSNIRNIGHCAGNKSAYYTQSHHADSDLCLDTVLQRVKSNVLDLHSIMTHLSSDLSNKIRHVRYSLHREKMLQKYCKETQYGVQGMLKIGRGEGGMERERRGWIGEDKRERWVDGPGQKQETKQERRETTKGGRQERTEGGRGWRGFKMRLHQWMSSIRLDHDPPCSTVKWWHQGLTKRTLCGQFRHNSRWKMDKSRGHCGVRHARLSGCLSLDTSMMFAILWHIVDLVANQSGNNAWCFGIDYFKLLTDTKLGFKNIKKINKNTCTKVKYITDKIPGKFAPLF